MRTIKYIAIIAFALLIIIIGSGVIVSSFFGTEIKKVILAELQRNLTTEFHVEEDFNFSVIKNFPEASLEFSAVRIQSSLPDDTTIFLKANTLSLQFNIWDLVNKKYDIKTLVLENGAFNIEITNTGSKNYNIWKKSEKGNPNFSIHLDHVKFHNVKVNYINRQNSQHYDLTIKNGSLSGDLSAENYLLNIHSELDIRKIIVKQINYLDNRTVDLNLSLAINTKEKTYKFTNGEVVVDNSELFVEGEVNQKMNTNLDLTFTAKKITIESLVSLLPQKINQYLTGFSSKGKLNFIFTLSGIVKDLAVNVTFGLANGVIAHNKLDYKLKEVTFSGSFSNGQHRNIASSTLLINDFVASIDGNPLSFDLKINDFTDPVIDMQINASTKLAVLKPYFTENEINGVEGNLGIDHLSINGKLYNEHGKVNKGINVSGDLVFNQVALRWKDHLLSKLTGKLIVDSKGISTNELSLSINNNDLTISARASNLTTLLLEEIFDSTSSLGPIQFIGRLTSDKVNFIELLQLQNLKKKSDSKFVLAVLLKLLQGNLALKLGAFTYNSFDATEVEASLQFASEKIYIDNLAFNVMGGQVASRGTAFLTSSNNIIINTKSELHKINITQLFEKCGNFGQVVITDKHLKGEIDADLILSFTCDEKLTIATKEIEAQVELVINEGELIDFEPLFDLSKFVKLEELENIKFSRLYNQIEIKEGKIYIPSMEIISSAMDLTISGVHTFNNEIDYNLRVNLSDILSKKMKNEKQNLKKRKEVR